MEEEVVVVAAAAAPDIGPGGSPLTGRSSAAKSISHCFIGPPVRPDPIARVRYRSRGPELIEVWSAAAAIPDVGNGAGPNGYLLVGASFSAKSISNCFIGLSW